MNMKTIGNFPDWIASVAAKNQDSINKESQDCFDKVKELYPHFVSTYINIPSDKELGVLKSHNPSEVSDYFQKDGPLEFIIFNIYETFHFVFVYQIRELSLIMQDCLESGKFFGAAIINRSIFELVCTNYYTFRRIESKFSECIEVIKKLARTKSAVEKETLKKQYFEKLYEIYAVLHRGNTASSINWQEHMQKFGLAKSEDRDVERIHISTAVEDIQKQSKMPLQKIYGLMSEFVHPNYGSKTLIIKTSSKHNDLMDKLTIGENQNNGEAALFYIDQCSEGLYTTLTLAMSLIDRSVRLLSALDQFTESGKKTLH
jgi:hypothetical protein